MRNREERELERELLEAQVKAAQAQTAAALWQCYAIPEPDIESLVPHSTYRKLRYEGNGPPSIVIGRRRYVRIADLRRWIDALPEADPSDDDEKVAA